MSAVGLSVFMKRENVAEKSRFQAFPHRRHKTRRRLFSAKIWTEAEDFPALRSYDKYAAVDCLRVMFLDCFSLILFANFFGKKYVFFNWIFQLPVLGTSH